jgi:hypothetical protein
MSPHRRPSQASVLKSRKLREQSAQLCAQARTHLMRNRMLREEITAAPWYSRAKKRLHHQSLTTLQYIETELERLGGWVGG